MFDCTVSVSLGSAICLSDLPCHASDYCIIITKKSGTSITVIYHAMSDYCISITKKSYTSIAVIYHAMSLTVLYQYH